MISTLLTKVQYTGNGQTTAFPFTFPFDDGDDIKCAIRDLTTDVQTILTEDYYVDTEASIVYYPGYPPGETPAASEQPAILDKNHTITIYRETPHNQLTDLGDKYPLPTVEKMSDKVTMVIQELQEILDRCVKLNISSSEDVAEYLTLVQNAAAAAAASQAAAKESETNAAESAEEAAETVEAGKTAISELVSSGSASLTSTINAGNASLTKTINDGLTTIGNTTTAGVNTVNAARDNAVNTVNSTRDSAVSAVTTAKTEAVSAVNTAKTAALAEITPNVKAAADSATAAANSASAAATSASNAKTSETNSGKSASAAATSETNAAASATAAAGSASAAATSETNAANSETNAGKSASAAATSETNAANSETNAGKSASAAAASESNAADSASSAADSKKIAGEYAEKAENYYDITYHTKGSVNTYADLPIDPENGDVYKILTADSEHGVRAGDKVAWVDSSNSWENFAGSVDLSGYVPIAEESSITFSLGYDENGAFMVTPD